MLSAILYSFLWLLPYLISGFSAPFIFKHASTPQVGGHYAGMLFIFASLWAVFLSWRHEMPTAIKVFFIFVFALQIVFWSWRFLNSAPLKESILVGISGSAWHGILTSLYLVVGILIFVFEMKKRV